MCSSLALIKIKKTLKCIFSGNFNLTFNNIPANHSDLFLVAVAQKNKHKCDNYVTKSFTLKYKSRRHPYIAPYIFTKTETTQKRDSVGRLRLFEKPVKGNIFRKRVHVASCVSLNDENDTNLYARSGQRTTATQTNNRELCFHNARNVSSFKAYSSQLLPATSSYNGRRSASN